MSSFRAISLGLASHVAAINLINLIISCLKSVISLLFLHSCHAGKLFSRSFIFFALIDSLTLNYFL
jgi:hypothetical protein